MNTQNNKKEKPSFFSALKDKLSVKKQAGMLTSTVAALILITVLQIVVIAIDNGGNGKILSTLLMSWLNVLRNNSYTGIIAFGMCFVIVSGGIDLSVGSMVCAEGAALMFLIDPSSGLLVRLGLSGPFAYVIAIIATLLLGALLGLFNGFLISVGKLPPFIATLGTMKIYRSVTQQLTKQFNPSVPSDFKQIASMKAFASPDQPGSGQVILPIIYWAVILAIMFVIFKKMPFGKKTVATGSNERAARFSGINVGSVKCGVYMLSGILCAVAAVIYVARIGSMDFANAGSGYEMDTIAAVIVGGTSMSGGKGSIIGTFVGMLIIGVMNSVLNMLGAPTFLCDAIRGAIIIAAVLVQQARSTKDN